MRSRVRIALTSIGILAGCTGCQTGFGRYFGARARDLGDVFRVQVGGGIGLGVGVKLAALGHFGLGGGMTMRPAGIGWIYGEPYAFGASPKGAARHDIELYTLVTHVQQDGWVPSVGEFRRHECHALLPTVFGSDVYKRKLRGDFNLHADPRSKILQRLHWFDVEASVYAGVLVFRFGISFGELLDFFGGWFGWDLAGDDVRVSSSRAP